MRTTTAPALVALLLAAGLTACGDPEPTAEDPTSTPSTSPSSSASATPEPSPTETSPTEPPTPAGPVPVYFVGDTPQGPRLYREFQPSDGGDPVLTAAERSVAGASLDPDYRSLWPRGAQVTAVSSDGADLLTVDVSGVPRRRPDGLSEEEAGLAIQQLVYTVQAALGQGRVGVQVLLEGDRSDMVLGSPTAEPLTNAPVLETLSHVSLTEPTEGAHVGDELVVTGVANSFEANVVVRVQRWEGTEIVAEEPLTAEGWMGERLFPFSGAIDLTGVPPGEYLVIAMTDDPTGGAEGGGAFTDTRRIVVE